MESRSPVNRRILYLAPFDVTLPQGHAAHVRSLVMALEARGHAVRLISLAPAHAGWPGPSAGWDQISLGPVPRLRHVAAQEAMRARVRRALRQFDPDVFAYRVETLSWAALGLSRNRPATIAESCSSVRAHQEMRGGPAWRSKLARWLEGRSLRQATRVRVLDDALAQLQAQRQNIPIARLRVVAVGTEIPASTAQATRTTRRRWGIGDGTFLAAFAGSLNAWQALDVVVEAVAALPHAERVELRVCVAGVGELRDDWEALVRERQVGTQIRFLGPLMPDEARALLQSAQIVIAPYREETLARLGVCGLGPLKVVEAMACDRPVLTSGGPAWSSREFPDGSPGERIGDDPASWSEALQRWKTRWEQAGRPLDDWPWPRGTGPGRARVARERSWDSIAGQWEAVMEEAIAAAAGDSSAR